MGLTMSAITPKKNDSPPVDNKQNSSIASNHVEQKPVEQKPVEQKHHVLPARTTTTIGGSRKKKIKFKRMKNKTNKKQKKSKSPKYLNIQNNQ